jgi:hypothetical protein
MFPGVNEECEYLDLETCSCILIDEKGQMPKLTHGCNCLECLIGLYKARGSRGGTRPPEGIIK